MHLKANIIVKAFTVLFSNFHKFFLTFTSRMNLWWKTNAMLPFVCVSNVSFVLHSPVSSLFCHLYRKCGIMVVASQGLSCLRDKCFPEFCSSISKYCAYCRQNICDVYNFWAKTTCLFISWYWYKTNHSIFLAWCNSLAFLLSHGSIPYQ